MSMLVVALFACCFVFAAPARGDAAADLPKLEAIQLNATLLPLSPMGAGCPSWANRQEDAEMQAFDVSYELNATFVTNTFANRFDANFPPSGLDRPYEWGTYIIHWFWYVYNPLLTPFCLLIHWIICVALRI